MAKAEKIMVVDDESSIRMLLDDALSSEGFEVSLARDGQECLEKMERGDFDLVITDLNMPRLDGIEMLQQMKRTGRKERVIILTGDHLDERFLDLEMPQVVTRLLKPIRLDRLLEIVSSVIAGGISGLPVQHPGC
jgi:DNA-binding NtrC family response regulator